MRAPRRLPAADWPRVIAPALILAAVAVVYGQTLGHGFVNFDDPVYVVDNPHVLRGLTAEGARWAFLTGLTGMWHPLAWLSLMANVSCFGNGPASFHAANAALHAANAILIYALLVTATGSMGRSLLVALLFAVHPLNVESVAWVSQRKSTLSTLFGLITLLAWVRYVRRGSRGAYAIALGAFALGLLAKPMLVSLPFLLVLLEVWPLTGRKITWRRKAGEWAPFFALAALFAWICLHSFGPSDVGSGGPQSLLANLGSVPLNVVTYLGRLVYPIHLAVLYPHRDEWSALACGLSLAGLLGVTAWLWRRRQAVVLMGWGWFLITLFPVSGVILIGPHATADRYAYLPAIGLFIAAAWGVPTRRAWAIAATAVVSACGVVAYAQVGLWRNSVTLWSHAAAVTPPSATQLVNFGSALAEAGRDDEAMTQLKQALVLNPTEHRAWLNLAFIYDRRGDKAAARTALREAMRLAPGDARIHNHLGTVLLDLGQPKEAEAELREAIRLRPEYAEPWVNLGVLFATRSDLPAAIRAFERALQIQPFVVGAQQNLARAQAELAKASKRSAPVP